MRKLVVGLFVTLDGVMEGPGQGDNFEYAGWTMPYFSPEVGQVLGESMMNSDALLLGRKTYASYEETFGQQTGGMADAMNGFHKYVVSTTLRSADWNNSSLISENVVAAIQNLKQQPGKNIVVTGSGTLIQTLIKHDLIDEYSLMVYPVALGSGARLFREKTRTPLKLISATPFPTGVVHMVYQPDRER